VTIWLAGIIVVFAFRSWPRSHESTVDSMPTVPSVGDTLSWPAPPILSILRRRFDRSIEDSTSLLMVLRSDCPLCLSEVDSVYPSVLSKARETGTAVRVLVVQAPNGEIEDFLARLGPVDGMIALDSLGQAREMGILVAPSALVLSEDLVVQASFRPGRNWPPSFSSIGVVTEGP
jgi:hypothetical protein